MKFMKRGKIFWDIGYILGIWRYEGEYMKGIILQRVRNHFWTLLIDAARWDWHFRYGRCFGSLRSNINLRSLKGADFSREEKGNWVVRNIIWGYSICKFRGARESWEAAVSKPSFRLHNRSIWGSFLPDFHVRGFNGICVFLWCAVSTLILKHNHNHHHHHFPTIIILLVLITSIISTIHIHTSRPWCDPGAAAWKSPIRPIPTWMDKFHDHQESPGSQLVDRCW